MTRTEQQILGSTIKAICRHNSYLWWELKRQIWDGGYQPFYPRQSEYEDRISRAIGKFDEATLDALGREWKRYSSSAETAPEAVRAYYEAVVMEEVVRRATAAAYRTVHW
jgi:hypothetical protein